MDTNILIIISTVVIVAALYFFRRNNESSSMNSESTVKVELSKEFADTLSTIKNFVEESKKKTEENFAMFSDFESMMTNRQERGAFHEKEMETILRDRLPKEFVKFQYTLPNKKRVDGFINFENDNLKFCIDSKSFYESYELLRSAGTAPEVKSVEKSFSDDVISNAKKISEDYIIPGFTTDYALMFVRSENVFKAMHDVKSIDIIEECLKLKVIPVSPTYLWALVNNLKEFLKDKNFVEKAKEIKTQISSIKLDIEKWTTAVSDAQRKFENVAKDFRAIHRASENVKDKIEKLDEIENNTKEGNS